ncbi:hatching enzyme 1.2-like [Paramacrobiotus metropolitanus]|uniref:hatching enzyme 1.2-like n=1 Tax=Paramacrobiotus metropolitanus TaxID=2943436 RepID=UPI002445ABC4|nr:hatching enzyme 1.2-like [Paramacrobiotus metropolitanus]
MALLVVVCLFAVLSSVLAAPATINGKTPIDRTCTTSPVRSADPVKCFTPEAVKSGEPTEPLLFEGDIAGVIQPGDTITDLHMKLNSKSKAGTLQYARWWGAYVYYEIDDIFTEEEREIIMGAFKEFEKTDVVRFYPRSSQEDYIKIFKGSGCWSYVGMLRGMQQVSIGPGCAYHGIVVHELNHAIGFWHEQSRPDRDDYVDLNLDNVHEGLRYNFDKYEASLVTTSNTGYDFASIMHYDQYAFAMDYDMWTIRPKPQYSHYEIGQRYYLTPTDIIEINSLYKLCATLWYEADYTKGESRFVGGIEANLHALSQDQFSSAKVTPGCALTLFNQVNFQGQSTVLRATDEVSEFSFGGQNYDNDARSLKCTCS